MVLPRLGNTIAPPAEAILAIYRQSLCTCENAAENDAFGSCFRHPFHHTPTRASGRFNLFLGSGAPSAQRASTAEPLLMFSTSTLTHPPHLPPSSEGPILAPRALSPMRNGRQKEVGSKTR